MGQLEKTIVFIVITLLTGVIQFFTSRRATPTPNANENELGQIKRLRQWGLFVMILAIVVSPFYFVFQNNQIIPIVIYGVGLILLGVWLRYSISKVEANYKVKENIDKKEEKKEEKIIETCPECGEHVIHEEYEKIVECSKCGCIYRLDNGEVVKHGNKKIDK